ncbi:hypothetical protein BH24ACT22_BH24ACT22_01240 [soil metagenome]
MRINICVDSTYTARNYRQATYRTFAAMDEVYHVVDWFLDWEVMSIARNIW